MKRFFPIVLILLTFCSIAIAGDWWIPGHSTFTLSFVNSPAPYQLSEKDYQWVKKLDRRLGLENKKYFLNIFVLSEHQYVEEWPMYVEQGNISHLITSVNFVWPSYHYYDFDLSKKIILQNISPGFGAYFHPGEKFMSVRLSPACQKGSIVEEGEKILDGIKGNCEAEKVSFFEKFVYWQRLKNYIRKAGATKSPSAGIDSYKMFIRTKGNFTSRGKVYINPKNPYQYLIAVEIPKTKENAKNLKKHIAVNIKEKYVLAPAGEVVSFFPHSNGQFIVTISTSTNDFYGMPYAIAANGKNEKHGDCIFSDKCVIWH
jgi:hypothetical protein